MNLKFLIAASQDFPIGFLNSTSFFYQNRCTCQHCQQQTAAEENLCCQVIPAVAEKVDEAEDEPISCITDHPGFIAVCTNVWSLETAWHQYKQQYDNPYEGPRHKKLRHVAYRQFVQWIWHYLGRHVRVILPSCAVLCYTCSFSSSRG